MRWTRSLIIALALVMVSLLPLLAYEGVADEPPSRAPDKYGSITSDETWSGPLAVSDVTIEENVTVTISNGAVISMYDGAEIWVRGTLLVQGSEAASDVVTFKLSFGSYWDGIVINDTGTADIQNASFSGGHNYIVIRGDDVRLKNVLFDTGWSGVSVFGGSGHDIDYILGKYMNNVLLVQSNTGPIDIFWVRGIEVTYEVVHLSNVHDVTVGSIFSSDSGTGLRIDGGCGGECGNITINRIIVNQTSPADPGSNGVVLWGPVHGLYLNDVGLGTLSTGMDINTDPGSTVTVRNLITDGSVFTLFNLDQDVHGIDMEVFDSVLEASGDIVNLRSDTADVHLNAISSRIEPGSITLLGEALFNVSWYLNLTFQDGAFNPMDCTLNTYHHGGGLFSSFHMPDGEGQMILPERSIFETGQTIHYFDLDLVVPNDVPVVYMLEENINIDENNDLFFVFDIPPYNDMQDEIEFEEDGVYEVNLSVFFHDLENDLTYDISAGPELDPIYMGGGPYPLLIIETVEDDWNGVSWVNIIAIDGAGNTTSANVTVTVIQVNDIPFFIDDVPVLTMEEDTIIFINFTGLVVDVDGDEVLMTTTIAENCTLSWDGSNLTIEPDENWFGILDIELNITDEIGYTLHNMKVNVTPVDDMPTAVVRIMNGSEAIFGTFPVNETISIDTYIFTLEEDSEISFWIDAIDIEGDPIIYGYNGSVLTFGNLIQGNDTWPMNFTFAPLENAFGTIDTILYLAYGEEGHVDDVEISVRFDITPVNDAPVLDAPVDWHYSIEEGVEPVIDISAMISDVDEDALSITVHPESFASVIGTRITLTIPDDVAEDDVELLINISDGQLSDSAVLKVFLLPGTIPLPEPALDVDSLEIVPGTDGWTINVYGVEGQTIYIVVEDGAGNTEIYPLTYKDGKYHTMIYGEFHDDGDRIYLSDNPGGGEILPSFSESLPELAEVDEGTDWALYLIIGVLLVMVLIVIVFLISRSRRDEYYEE